MELDPWKVEAQQALDELLKEGKLPFKLQARIVRQEGFPHNYVIYFHDSRCRSVTVHCDTVESFKELVRAAVLRKLASRDELGIAD